MVTTLEAENLVLVSCWCGIRHAVPKALRAEQLRMFNNGDVPFEIYCPLGHAHIPVGKTELSKQRAALAAADQTIARLRAEKDAAERRLSAQKAETTKLRNKISLIATKVEE